MSETLENLLRESRRFEPPAGLAAEANVTAEAYEQAGADRLGFWAEQAERLHWSSPGTRCSTGPTRRSPSGSSGGQLNIAYNCLDRHVEAGRGDKVAIHWEGEPGDTRTITYADLHAMVCQAANALTGLGVHGRRPGRDLPADDPRGGGRDARLRPDRRHPLRGVRRLLGGRAVRADPGRRRQGA